MDIGWAFHNSIIIISTSMSKISCQNIFILIFLTFSKYNATKLSHTTILRFNGQSHNTIVMYFIVSTKFLVDHNLNVLRLPGRFLHIHWLEPWDQEKVKDKVPWHAWFGRTGKTFDFFLRHNKANKLRADLQNVLVCWLF